jgi:hypothetical protein
VRLRCACLQRKETIGIRGFLPNRVVYCSFPEKNQKGKLCEATLSEVALTMLPRKQHIHTNITSQIQGFGSMSQTKH